MKAKRTEVRSESSERGDGEGCGCPECAQLANRLGDSEVMAKNVMLLRHWANNGNLMIFDPKTKSCLTDDDIAGVCVNGNSIQITLRFR